MSHFYLHNTAFGGTVNQAVAGIITVRAMMFADDGFGNFISTDIGVVIHSVLSDHSAGGFGSSTQLHKLEPNEHQPEIPTAPMRSTGMSTTPGSGGEAA